MDILKMHQDIEQSVQRMGFYIYDHLESEEIDIQINKQIVLFVENIIDKAKRLKRGDRDAFNETQVELDKLRTLIKIDNTSFTTPNLLRFQNVILPEDYYHLLGVDVDSSYSCYINGSRVNRTVTAKARQYLAEIVSEVLSNPIHEPTKDSPICYISTISDINRVFVYTGENDVISRISLTYIKSPVEVKYNKDVSGNYTTTGSVNCDLPVNIHQHICDLTATRIMKIIESNPNKIISLQQEQ